MKMKIFLTSFIVLVLLTIVLSYEITSYYLGKEEVADDVYDIQIENSNDAVSDVAENDIIKDDEVIETDTIKVDKILPSTRIIYQKYYTLDDTLDSLESEPPYYILDMSREDIENYYTEWQLVAFSDEIVVLRKNIEGKNPEGYYIVKEYDGEIAVYFDYTNDLSESFKTAVESGEYSEDNEDDLKEYTEMFLLENRDNYLREVVHTSVSILSQDERDKLKEGIVVYGDDELIRLLENYTS